MIIKNLTSDYYYLSGDVKLTPEVEININGNLYVGNETLQSQIDNLYLQGKLIILGAPEGFPLSVPAAPEEPFVLPEKYELHDQDLIILHKSESAPPGENLSIQGPNENLGNGVAALSVDSNIDDTAYGSVKLVSSSGSEAGIVSYEDSKRDGMIYAYKVLEEEEQKHFDIRTGGFRLTLDPSSVTTEDLANFLIDLGLADSE